ncbi:uncharacterized protein ACLA_019530 [Aspergillus clavatus NRRL 1]|uniref:Uncharacterized protein n=1 Tax=Aspergillus clavatus (strain ATCC 1007 / CBS 513.65 / DSM 816 / NCTC 3887 / NRRL 1 / QM 1276 / 107) TaxID=344612 RepID=A1CNM7_ASPCL|nr:uncharacterized protein ACLA_019530 [Aspergillus clavatus NRRL 1]EAW07248.1 conserved hypothetical protein [Aspergillus clavatus NRRL 1]
MESPASFESSSYRGNRIVAYLQTLARAKNGLPHGVPVCVCPSHTITTTKALLELASLLGSHIAILQVHADIIDDWSDETVRQLTLLAKRHAFLIWESGRILNATVDVVGNQKSESREVRNEMVDLIRKKYTKGVVKAASWAGIATAWASGVAVGSQEADILIPTLKAAAREAVADSVQTIRTEITAVNTPSESYLNGPEAELEEDSAAQQHLTLDYAVDDSGLGLALRKSSTISLTQTITQHTEDSTESLLDTVTQLPHETISQTDIQHISHGDDLPPPPLLARGLVLCLPSVTDTSFTPEYRQSCLAAARANQDFVLGFICSEPWHIVSQHDGIFNDQSSEWDERNGCEPYSSDETPACLAIFSVISHKINMLAGHDDGDESDEEMSPTTPVAPSLPSRITSPLASKLHTIVGQAIKLRETTMKHTVNGQLSSNLWNSTRVMHVPVVSLP